MSIQNKLYELLSLHDENKQNQTLPLSLGDSSLYTHNPVFKFVRNHFLQLNYTLTTDDFCHYHVLPYASLPTILQQKKVPYADNVTVLREIENRFPKRFKCDELIKVKSNYTLHESSHCIADHYIKSLNCLAQLAPHITSAESQKAFLMIMAESYANAVESMANVFNTSAEQRLFYELNSYITHSKKINTSLQQTLDLIGFKNTFKLIYVSYIFSNSLNVDVNHKDYILILQNILQDDLVFARARDSSSVRKLFSHAFELSLDFRLQTTGFFCAFSGLNSPLPQLLKWNTLSIVTQSSVINNFVAAAVPG